MINILIFTRIQKIISLLYNFPIYLHPKDREEFINLLVKRTAMDIRAYIELSRPLNLLVVSIAILLAAFMTKEINYEVVYAIISVVLITSGGNGINDYFDFKIDRVNKPKRPIPSGKITKSGAYRFSMAMFILGIGISFLINIYCVIISLFASVLLYIYAKDLKNSGFPGNLTIAGLTGLAIIYAGISVSSIDRIAYVAIFAFLINLGREIIKDVEDYEGDISQGARTLPIKYGIKKALYTSLVPLIMIILITPIPYYVGLYSQYYMAIMIIGIDLPIFYIVYKITNDPSIKNAEVTKSILKVLIIIGIVGLYLGL